MPSYDFRCNSCGRELDLFYKTYADYDAAQHQCPYCNSTDLVRLIRRVSVQSGERNYASMSSQEMLSVLESGQRSEVDTMYRQLGQDPGTLGAQAQSIKKAKDGAQKESRKSASSPKQG